MDEKKLKGPIGPSLKSRRDFIFTAVAGLTATALFANSRSLLFSPPKRIRAIAFDAFAVFDPRPIFALTAIIFPEKGAELANIWRAKQFEYCWLRTAGSRYVNFWDITEDALVFAVRKTGVTLTPDTKNRLMEQYHNLPIWSDVLPTLRSLGESGVRLFFLSNMTLKMLEANIKNSQLENYFDEVISTDIIERYKPSAAAYQLGIDKLMLTKEEILFVAVAGWDASGSKWFGYPTFWLNRLEQPAEELDAVADGMGKNMGDLINFIKR